jgi:hypothetical protein
MGKVNLARGLILGGAAWSLGGITASGVPVYGPGSFGAEDPVEQPWDFKPFDIADEAMTAGVPDSVVRTISQAFTTNPDPMPQPQPFTYSPALIP